MKRNAIAVALALGASLLSSPAATYLVTTTADAGPGSLRQAILDANAPGPDVIQFQFPLYPVTITPVSPLPDILDGGVIDATDGSLPCLNPPKPRVQINGVAVGGSFVPGLAVRTPAPVVIKGLAIYGFSGPGVLVEANTGSKILGNYLGTDASGTLFGVGNVTGIQLSQCNDVVVGGAQPCERNVISGNRGGGVDIMGGTHNMVLGNFIGTAATGTWALGNQYGVQVNAGAVSLHQVGSTNPGEANVISGNSTDGVVLTGPLGVPSDNHVEGNFIGTQTGGALPIPNGASGVHFYGGPTHNFVRNNVIKFNGSDGVLVLEGTDNTIVENSISDNGRLGIDLTPMFVVNPNDPLDPDAGPNRQQNYPTFVGAVPPMSGASGTSFLVDLNSEPTTPFVLHFYWSPACDPSGFGEGKHFFAQTNVTTDALGNMGLTLMHFAATVPLGSVLTATATHPGGSTSEFSPCSPGVVATSPNVVTHSGLPHQIDGNGTLQPQADGTLAVRGGSNGVQITLGGAEGWLGTFSNFQVSTGGAVKSLYLGQHGYMNAVQWSGESELRLPTPGRAEVRSLVSPATTFMLRVELFGDDGRMLESALVPNGATYPVPLCASNNTLHVRSAGVLRMKNGAPASYWQFDDEYCGTRPPGPVPPHWKMLRVYPESTRVGGQAGGFRPADICDTCPQCCFPYYVAIDLVRIIPEPPPCLSCPPDVLFLGPEFVEIFQNLHENIGGAVMSPWLDFQGPQPSPWLAPLGPYPQPWTGGELMSRRSSAGGENGLNLIPNGSGLPLPPTDGGVDPHDASALARYVGLDFNASGAPGAAASWVRFVVEGPVPVGPGDPVEHVLYFQASERGWIVSANFGPGAAGAPGAMVQLFYHGAPVGQLMPLQSLEIPSLPGRVAASTGVSPTGAPGFDLRWATMPEPFGPFPQPWDQMQIRPMSANTSQIPWIARYRVRYDGLELFSITGEQNLPASPGSLSLRRTQGAMQLSYPTEPGRPYRVEYTQSITTPNWQVLEDFTGDGAMHEVVDQVRIRENRFYRLAGY